jgi:hypothetical protein
MAPPTTPPTSHDDALDPRIARELAAALRRLWFGSITIVVHDGAIQSIDILEKRRVKLK